MRLTRVAMCVVAFILFSATVVNDTFAIDDPTSSKQSKPTFKAFRIKFFRIPDPDSFIDQQKLKVDGLKWYVTHPKEKLFSVAYCEGEVGGITSLVYEPVPAAPTPNGSK